MTAYEVIEAAKAQQSDEARYKMLVELNLGYIEKILSEQLRSVYKELHADRETGC